MMGILALRSANSAVQECNLERSIRVRPAGGILQKKLYRFLEASETRLRLRCVMRWWMGGGSGEEAWCCR